MEKGKTARQDASIPVGTAPDAVSDYAGVALAFAIDTQVAVEHHGNDTHQHAPGRLDGDPAVTDRQQAGRFHFTQINQFVSEIVFEADQVRDLDGLDR